MKKILNIIAIFLMIGFTSSCILEDVEPEYDVVGAVGTISALSVSNTSPSEGQTVTFSVTIYSEHENATELRMNRISGGNPTNITTRTFSSWNKEDSYVETFQYEIPTGTSGTAITIQFELVTESGFSATRNIVVNVQS
ncbi:hypothetical protein ACFSKL_10890 [Belliella marina]|uniref:DUF4625 domain-containing protein n=1 Tax=Belliella marina TaxID=1644146 RepID=A0ABW4VMG4_9BACT